MKGEWDTKTIILIVLSIVIVGLLFDKTDPLPPNCHHTPSVDVGGGDIECD